MRDWSSDVCSSDLLRSLRIANLQVRPVAYNPVSGVLKVWTNIEFRIHFDGADLSKTEDIKQKYYSPYFEAVYEQVSNYEAPDVRDDLVRYPVTYLKIGRAHV